MIESTAVWVVDGQRIRDSVDIEFTNFGQHYAFPFIPVTELWLDQEHTPGEQEFFIAHLLLERRLMADGTDYDTALEQADHAERTLRSRSRLGKTGAALLAAGDTVALLARIHKELLAAYSTDVKVWVVDGELVRDVFFVDFTLGGHDRVYRFIPAKEVWIDDDVMPREREVILLHEFHERSLMLQGWMYDSAHAAASRVELEARHDPKTLPALLMQQIDRSRPHGS